MRQLVLVDKQAICCKPACLCAFFAVVIPSNVGEKSELLEKTGRRNRSSKIAAQAARERVFQDQVYGYIQPDNAISAAQQFICPGQENAFRYPCGLSCNVKDVSEPDFQWTLCSWIPRFPCDIIQIVERKPQTRG